MRNLNVVITKENRKIEVTTYKGLPQPYNVHFKVIFYDNEVEYFMPRKNYFTGYSHLHQQVIRYGVFDTYRELLDLIQAEIDMCVPGSYSYYDSLFREVAADLCYIVNTACNYKSTINFYGVTGKVEDINGVEGDIVVNFTPTGMWFECPHAEYDDDDDQYLITSDIKNEPDTWFEKYSNYNEEYDGTPCNWLHRKVIGIPVFKIKSLVGIDGVEYTPETIAEKIAASFVPIHWGK